MEFSKKISPEVISTIKRIETQFLDDGGIPYLKEIVDAVKFRIFFRRWSTVWT